MEDGSHLIFENPIFQPFSFKSTGLTGRLDEKRTRYSFECYFRDIVKDSQGKVDSLIVFNDRNEAYFESLTINITRPVEQTIRLQETTIDYADEELK